MRTPGKRVKDPQQQILYECTHALAQSPTLEEAAPRMLEAICEALGWQCGAIWEINRPRTLMRCVGTWHTPGLPLDEFAAATTNAQFTRGIGLPGRVWEHREPAWIPDVTRDTNFPRAPIAERVGLHAAFALPILDGRRVQLINGEIIEMAAMNRPHADALNRVRDALLPRLPTGGLLYQQVPIGLWAAKPRDGNPEPDALVIESNDGQEAIALIVEISDTTLDIDLEDKPRLYAIAGGPVYWVLDLNGRRLHVFTEPAGGTTLAATIAFVERGVIPRHESVVVCVTGNGYKTVEAVQGRLAPPVTLGRSLDEFEAWLGSLAPSELAAI